MGIIRRLSALGFGVGLGISGCIDRSQYFVKNGVIDGYETQAARNENGCVFLMIDEKPNEISYLCGLDRNCDGRFDKIDLDSVPKGHPIEKYADIRKISELFKQLRDQ